MVYRGTGPAGAGARGAVHQAPRTLDMPQDNVKAGPQREALRLGPIHTLVIKKSTHRASDGGGVFKYAYRS
jgi:hypothetical protein